MKSSSKPIISSSIHSHLFRNVDSLYTFQRPFTASLSDLVQKKDLTLKGLGKILLTWNSMLEAHAEFFLTFKKASTILESLKSTNNTFTTFLGNQSQSDLEDLISYPLNHIPRVESFVELILKYTLDGESEFDSLTKALLCLKESLSVLAKCQSCSEFFSIQKSFKNLSNSEGFVIREFRRLFQTHYITAFINKKNRQCLLYTFDDCLVLLRKQNSSNNTKFVSCFAFKKLMIQWDSSVDSHGLNVILSNEKTKITICFHNEKDKEQWIECIFNLIDDLSTTSHRGFLPNKQLKPLAVSISDALIKRTISKEDILSSVSSLRRIDRFVEQITVGSWVDFSQQETDVLLTVLKSIFLQYSTQFSGPLCSRLSPDIKIPDFETTLNKQELDVYSFLIQQLKKICNTSIQSECTKNRDLSNPAPYNLVCILGLYIFKANCDIDFEAVIQYIKSIPQIIDFVQLAVSQDVEVKI